MISLCKWKLENAVDERFEAALRPSFGAAPPSEERSFEAPRSRLDAAIAATAEREQFWAEMEGTLSDIEEKAKANERKRGETVAIAKEISDKIAPIAAEIEKLEMVESELRQTLTFFISTSQFEEWANLIDSASNKTEFRTNRAALTALFDRVESAERFFELRPNFLESKSQLRMLSALATRLQRAFLGNFENEYRSAFAAAALKSDVFSALFGDAQSANEATDRILKAIRNVSMENSEFCVRFFNARNGEIALQFAEYFFEGFFGVFANAFARVELAHDELFALFIVIASAAANALSAIIGEKANSERTAKAFADKSAIYITKLGVACRHIENIETFLRRHSLYIRLADTAPIAAIDELALPVASKRALLELFDDGKATHSIARAWLGAAAASVAPSLAAFLQRWLRAQAVSPPVDVAEFGQISSVAVRLVHLLHKAAEHAPGDEELRRLAVEHHSQAILAQSNTFPPIRRAVFAAQNLLFVAREIESETANEHFGAFEGNELNVCVGDMRRKAENALKKEILVFGEEKVRKSINELSPNSLRDFLIKIIEK